MPRSPTGWIPTRGASVHTGLVGAVNVAAGLVVALTYGCPNPPIGLVVAGALACAAPLLWRDAAPVLVALLMGQLPFASGTVAGLFVGLGWMTRGSSEPWRAAAVFWIAAAALPMVFVVARRRSLWGVAVVLLVPFAPALLDPGTAVRLGVSPALTLVGGVLVIVFLTFPLWFSGALLRRRAAERAAQAERERAWAERTVREERERVARELHGLVLADLARIGEEARRTRSRLAAAEDDGRAGRQEARAALTTVTTGGRDALTAMRRLLGMLRGVDADDPQEEAGSVPARLAELAGRVRAPGRPVELTVTGLDRPLPDEVDLATYRIAQEVLGRAGPGPVALSVDRTDDAVLLVATGDLATVAVPVVREWARLARGTVRRSTPHRLEARLAVRSRRPARAPAGPDAGPATSRSEQ